MLNVCSRFLCILVTSLFSHQVLADDICGSAPISCNSLHNLNVTVDKIITDTDSALVTVSFMQYANWHTGGAFMLFTPQVTFELDGQFVDQMQMTDINPLIQPYTYNYYGNIYIQTLIKYEYQFEWDLRDSNDLPQQLFASFGIKVNAGAKNLATATTLVVGFENDLGPQNCELGVGSQCNMLNGNLYYQQTDYAHQGTHLSFQRHYNSLQKVTSAVTKGDWSSTGGAKVLDFSFFLSNGKKLYLYLDEQGQYEYFHEQTDGSFKADNNVDLQFITTANGFEISRPNGQTWHHDTSGKLVSMTDVSGNTTQYLYQNNKLSEIKGVYGHSLTFTYNVQDKLSAVNTPDNQQITYQYNTEGLLADVVWPDGRKESYSYNATGDLTTITRNDTDVIQQNTFDAHGRVLTHNDIKANNEFTLSYQSLVKSGITSPSKLSDYELNTEVTDDKGNHWFVKSGYSNGEQLMTDYQHQSGQDTYLKNYDTNGNLSSITDPQGNITGYTYNQDDQLLSMSRGQGTTEEQIIEYDYVSNDIDLPTKVSQSSTSSAFNNQLHDIEMFYNTQYQVQSVVEKGHSANGAALLRTSQLSYDTSGRILSIDGFADGNNDITQLTYHLCNTGEECGQVATVTNAVGDQTQFTDYDAAGRITKMIQPNNTVVDTTYNTSGDVLSTTLTSNSVSRTTTYQYTQGLLTNITLPNGEVYSLTYNNNQKISHITDSVGDKQVFHYDSRDNVIREELLDNTAALHYEISRTVDRLDQINSVTTINGTTSYNINNIGLLTQKTDALVENDFYQYDSLSRLLKHTDALTNETSYSYNNHDQLLSVTDAQGNITTYEYDDFGRVTSQQSPATGSNTYQYDNADNLTSSTDARNITTQYQYDQANRVTQISYPNVGEDISLTYTNASLPDTVTHSSGQSHYVYNGFNDLIQHTDTLNGQNFSVDYDYNTNGKLSLITYPDGTQVQYQYTNERISNVTLLQSGTSTVLASNMSYQPFGPLNQLTYGNGIQLSKTYNTAYQPSNITVTGIQNDDYLHDVIGNISQIQSNQGVTDNLDLSYDALDRLITANNTAEQHSYVYDGIANRLSHTQNSQVDNYSYLNDTLLSTINGSSTTTLQYDNAGNLLQKGTMLLTYNQAGQLQAANISSNNTQYSYNHLRQRVVKTLPDSSEIFYQYLPDGRLLTETNASGSVYKHYIWLEQQLLAVVDKTSGSSTAQLLYAHNDHLNTVTSLSNTNGDTVWKAKYTPFGLGTINEDVDNNGINIQFNLRFAGQYYDQESGLHYNYHRYYDPETGRYITSDPIGLAGGINTYGYVGGNPVSRFDPYGLDAKITVWQPVGWGSSSFGHVSTSIDGTTWSWGPNGMTITPTNDYRARNGFRSGVTSNVPLTPKQTTKLADYLNDSQGWYGALGNNCAAPIQRGLLKLGIDTGDVVLPVSLGNKLLDLGVVNKIVLQSPVNPSSGRSAPWAR
jgi:RHS repeat-associated protein